MGAYEHIMVGVDGSEASAEAAAAAGRLATDLGAKVTAVYVRQLPTVVAAPLALSVDLDLDRYWTELERQASTRTAEVLDRLGAPWRFEARTGDPAAELDNAAAEHGADLIIVGARGHSVAHRLLLGSVSSRLVHHGRRPVLIVR
ncbi:MAG TPA: universal stress protein [Actinomycetota bacterium]|jgi:nucleotide-binding universal stress UspA family protein|nr:universal stress protein [Actinomycetota bacterium]